MRHLHVSINDREFFIRCRLAQRAFFDAIFQHNAVGDRSHEVDRCRDGDAGFVGVIADAFAEQVCDVCDLHCCGEPAASAHVGLHDVHSADAHEVIERSDARFAFARCDARGRACGKFSVAFKIVRLQGLLDPERVELAQHFLAEDSRLPVPAAAHVDHQIAVGSKRLAGGSNEITVELHIASERPPAELHRGEARLHPLLADLVGFLGRVAEEDAGVRAELGVVSAAEQAIDRLFVVLARDVPEGDVAARDGVYSRAEAAVVNRCAIHLVPERADVERILPDERVAQAVGDEVRHRRLDDRLGDVRRRVDFTRADNAFVGVDADDQIVLRAIAIGGDVGEAEVDRFDFGDLHGVFRFLGSG